MTPRKSTGVTPQQIEAIADAVARKLREPAPPPTPVADPDRDRAAEHLVFALHIYGGYTVSSRGPSGCIMDALDEIAPEVAAEIRATDADEVYRKRWAEP